MEKRIPILAVLGPTASGKTSLGIGLAEKYSGEIISCDSMQIYQGLEIGTAKPTEQERERVMHHLVDFCPLDRAFSVSDYIALADKAALKIHNRKKNVVLVGGTGLYARSFLRGIEFQETCRDDQLREELTERVNRGEIQELYRKLQELDPIGARGIHPNNHKRVIRALEYSVVTGEPFSEQERRSREQPDKYPYCMLVLSFRNRETLYQRINRRVDSMMEMGLLKEAEDFYHLVKQSEVSYTASQAIGYKELFAYFDGMCPLGEAVENIKRETRRYAKRQLTWFRREEERKVLYVDDYKDGAQLMEEAYQLVLKSEIFAK